MISDNSFLIDTLGSHLGNFCLVSYLLLKVRLRCYFSVFVNIYLKVLRPTSCDFDVIKIRRNNLETADVCQGGTNYKVGNYGRNTLE